MNLIIYFADNSTTSSPLNIYTISAGLLAFILAFYALVARERKTPYITKSIYFICGIILFTLSITVLSDLINYEPLSGFLKLLSVISLIFCLIYIFVRIVVIHNRHINFRDDSPFKNSIFVRKVKYYFRKIRKGKPYEHNPDAFDGAFIAAIGSMDFVDNDTLMEILDANKLNKSSLSVALSISDKKELDYKLSEIVGKLHQTNCFFQYMSCSRHPIEFVKFLERKEDQIWESIKKRLVVVDAYTPHFGFTDSIYTFFDAEIENSPIPLVKSSPTYAGMHTAATKAFNEVRKIAKSKNQRPVTVVIYETPYAVSEVESEEQYKIFLRHVIPSEKLWGGMITIWIENGLNDDSWKLLKSLADIHWEQECTAIEPIAGNEEK